VLHYVVLQLATMRLVFRQHHAFALVREVELRVHLGHRQRCVARHRLRLLASQGASCKGPRGLWRSSVRPSVCLYVAAARSLCPFVGLTRHVNSCYPCSLLYSLQQLPRLVRALNRLLRTGVRLRLAHLRRSTFSSLHRNTFLQTCNHFENQCARYIDVLQLLQVYVGGLSLALASVMAMQYPRGRPGYSTARLQYSP
jgi:hypothetical protein